MSKVTQFPNLLAPGRIGTLELPNRLFQTAMLTNLANTDGTISDDIVAFYAARAAGGAALLTMGAVGVSYPRGQVGMYQTAISDDRFLPGLRRMTDAIHRSGARISAQLHHGGTSSSGDIIAGIPLLCPSLPAPQRAEGESMVNRLFPEELAFLPAGFGAKDPQFKEMDEDDIARLIGDFADGASRAVEAGFDAIELHAGHRFIISSFLSPAENRRSDGYGGSAQNRARLMREIIEAVRQRIGRDFPMLCKINAAEFYVEGGLTLDDVRTTAQIAEKAGVDAITVTTRHNNNVAKALFSSFLPHEPAKLIPYAWAVKEVVSLPVVTAGRIDPETAERAIGEGKFDFMAMGRKQIADSDFARHLSEGGARAVRPCIYDYRCISQASLDQPLRCAANPDVGFQNDDLLSPTQTPRRVVVVGGGPSGMEAARRLTLRGHSVTLLEAGAQLGGAARTAALTHRPNGHLVEWLEHQLGELKVEVRVNSPATLEGLRALSPDAVIVATGAIQCVPDIEGADLPHVRDLASLHGVLTEDDGGGDQQIVIIGGELVGLQLAEFLHECGQTVGVVDDVPQLGWGLSPARRSVMLAEMAETDIALHPGVTDIRIEADGVAFTDKHGEPVRLAAGRVIIVKGAERNPVLFEELNAAGFEAHMVGDCAGMGYMQGAMRTAADVAAGI